ncbi:MAG: nucleotidyltransferase [Phycisphaeraceae bacterium]|nr:nucleotidyltransferase [Phycisphaeraceae bacterium]
MVTMNDIRSRRSDILAIANRHGAHRVRVFGSVVTGKQNPDSDLDLLVDLDETRSLLDQIALANELQDLLHCKIDVVDDQAVSPNIKQGILAEAVEL